MYLTNITMLILHLNVLIVILINYHINKKIALMLYFLRKENKTHNLSVVWSMVSNNKARTLGPLKCVKDSDVYFWFGIRKHFLMNVLLHCTWYEHIKYEGIHVLGITNWTKWTRQPEMGQWIDQKHNVSIQYLHWLASK